MIRMAWCSMAAMVALASSTAGELPEPDLQMTKHLTGDAIYVIGDAAPSIDAYADVLDSGDVYKREADLTPADMGKALFLYGSIEYYKNWASYDVPIRQIAHGFGFGPREYTSPEDAIWLVLRTPPRLVFVSNHPGEIEDSGPWGLYDYMLLSAG